MKDGIHPDYVPAQVSCACGSSFITRSSRGNFQVDVCSKCHPFYTGTQKLMDAAGRVDRFNKRYGAKPAAPAAAKKASPAVAASEAAPAAEAPKA